MTLLTHTLAGPSSTVSSPWSWSWLPSRLLRVVSHAKCRRFVTELDPHLSRTATRRRRGARAGPAAAVFEDAFVISEKPASECNSSVVAVTAPIKLRHVEKPLGNDADGKDAARRIAVSARAEYALHNRYPRPARAGSEPYVSVSLRSPRVLVRCGGGTDHANRVPRDGWAADAARGCGASLKTTRRGASRRARAHFTFVAAATSSRGTRQLRGGRGVARPASTFATRVAGSLGEGQSEGTGEG